MPLPFASPNSRANGFTRGGQDVVDLTDQACTLSELWPPTTTTAKAIEQRAKYLTRIDRYVLRACHDGSNRVTGGHEYRDDTTLSHE